MKYVFSCLHDALSKFSVKYALWKPGVLASLTSSTSYSFETRHLEVDSSHSQVIGCQQRLGSRFFLVEVVDFTNLLSNLTYLFDGVIWKAL